MKAQIITHADSWSECKNITKIKEEIDISENVLIEIISKDMPNAVYVW